MSLEINLPPSAWSMKIMLGGVHPLTRHDLQPLDAQRSSLVGRPLGFDGGLFQARGVWSWYPQIFRCPWSSTMRCWRCKATYDDSVPDWDCSMGATSWTQRHKPGTCFMAQRLAGATVSPLFTRLVFDLGHGMRWHHASCGVWTWGVTQAVFGQHLQ